MTMTTNRALPAPEAPRQKDGATRHPCLSAGSAALGLALATSSLLGHLASGVVQLVLRRPRTS